MLPELGQVPTTSLPDTYQSIGSYAVLNMVGRMVSELYPPGMPWFQLALRPEIQYSQELDPQEIIGMNEILMLMELMIQSSLETAGLRGDGNRRPGGFLSQKRKSLTQLIVTGDTLERLDDDLRLRVFRRDQYVTKRDSSGDVLYHATKESVDPFALTEDQFAASGLRADELADKPPRERMQDLYTLVEWQPRDKTWRIEQEVNGNEIHEHDEEISSYFPTAFKLSPDEDYGRGFVELNLGDLRSLNTLEKRRLEILGIMSKVVPVIDHGSPTREEDLTLDSGVPIRARVRDGKIHDLAFLGFGNISEHQSLIQGIEMKTQNLARAFLVESASTRDAERVTAFERRRNAMELNSAVGGVYASISDSQHIPMLRRAIHVLKRSGVLSEPMKAVDEQVYEIRSLTGLTALVRESKAQALLELAQVTAALGPEALRRVDMGVLLKTYMNYRQLYEPGLQKSDEQLELEAQQAMAQEAQMQANQTAVETAGRVIEQTVANGG